MHLAQNSSEDFPKNSMVPGQDPAPRPRFEVIDGMSDRDLVSAVGAGDAAAWSTLIDRFGGMVWSVAISHGLCDSDASDVVQATWVNLFTNISTIRQPERVAGWLRTTARNEALGVLKRRGRATPVELDQMETRQMDAGQMNAGQLDPEPDPGDQVASAEGDPVLRSVLGQLNDGCRRMLLMLASDPPASYASVAEAVNVRLGTVGAKRRRCLDRLRTLYESAESAEVEKS